MHAPSAPRQLAQSLYTEDQSIDDILPGEEEFSLKSGDYRAKVQRLSLWVSDHAIHWIEAAFTDGTRSSCGQPFQGDLREVTFGSKEKVKSMTLYMTSVGTRPTGIRIDYGPGNTKAVHESDRSVTFGSGINHRMINVGSGILVRFTGMTNRRGEITRLTPVFIEEIDVVEITDVVPLADIVDSKEGITKLQLASTNYQNDQTETCFWNFAPSIQKTAYQKFRQDASPIPGVNVFITAPDWSLGGLPYDPCWKRGTDRVTHALRTNEVLLSGNCAGELAPDHGVSVSASAFEGRIEMRYNSTITVRFKNGARVEHKGRGTCEILAYSATSVHVVTPIED